MRITKLSILILFITNLAFAQQAKLSRSVFANGGNTMANQTYRISSTIGQAIIGKVSGPASIISSGFWYGDIDMVSSVEQISEQVPRVFRLRQNYPNPFNPSTTIAFSIAKSSKVNLTLYDILGRKVITLRDEKMQPGEYQFTFNATELASGLYFYRMSATDDDGESHVFTKKLTLIK